MNLQLDTIGLVVADMGRALAFYRTLGLPVPEGQTDEAHVELHTPGGPTLGFDTEAMVKHLDPNWPQPSGQRVGLQFRCETPADVDATYARVMAAGHGSHTAPWDAFWGQRFARVIDPDGNIVNFFAELHG